MPTYHLYGNTLDLSEADFLHLVRERAWGFVGSSETLSGWIAGGYPDVKNWIPEREEYQSELIEQLSDTDLIALLEQQQRSFAALYSIKEEAVAYIARLFGLDPSARGKIFYRLRNSKDNRGAVWAGEPDYRVFGRRALVQYDHIWSTDQTINLRIKALVEELGSTYTDPTLKSTPIMSPREAYKSARKTVEAQYDSDETRQTILQHIDDLYSDLLNEENNK
jgi:hypothetical protein